MPWCLPNRESIIMLLLFSIGSKDLQSLPYLLETTHETDSKLCKIWLKQLQPYSLYQ